MYLSYDAHIHMCSVDLLSVLQQVHKGVTSSDRELICFKLGSSAPAEPKVCCRERAATRA